MYKQIFNKPEFIQKLRSALTAYHVLIDKQITYCRKTYVEYAR